MPFTLAHPAIVVPLARRRLILSALVIGSMTPDFEYFIRFSDRGHLGHSIPGIFLFCIPMGLIVFILFHKLFKYPVLELMPANLQNRLLPVADKFYFGSLKNIMMIVLSLFIGAVSHLAWDSVTHKHGWFVRNFSVLRSPVQILPGITIEICRVLQHISTAIGIAVLIYFFISWYKSVPGQDVIFHKSHTEIIKLFKTLVIVSLAIAISGIYAIVTVRHNPLDSLNAFLRFLRTMVISGISILSIEFAIYSSFWHLVRKLNN